MNKSIITSLFVIGVLSANLAFATPQQAVEQVRGNATQVLTILQKANGANNASVRREAENYAVPYFDFDKMTRSAVGAQWNQATAEQKQTLVQEFKTLMLRTYSGQMFNYKNAKVTVQNNPVVRNGGQTIDVKVSVETVGQKPVQMVFSTASNGSKYLVHNVVIEGAINLVKVQNQQFAPILKSKGIEGLIADLKAKNGNK
ncbi:MAG: ABC transporter substrate-binding protein [Alysiella sp.]|uniref:MlaC/ttg2D family ABC transporter substrate-binding protein n=1 Tax=Alysiella sp. TaxID=1872483 RepID=UPI0026DDB0EA|nr:ABC transporter substrate-binding protein [Alysiella sp.]MDO4433197.1 ABC transporter substrate-binding protein [Alysiella sp.]